MNIKHHKGILRVKGKGSLLSGNERFLRYTVSSVHAIVSGRAMASDFEYFLRFSDFWEVML